MRCLSAANIGLREFFSPDAIFLLPLSRNSATGMSVKVDFPTKREITPAA
jgi:hypothetical protein